MASKSKQTKSTSSKVEEFNEKEFQMGVESREPKCIQLLSLNKINCIWIVST